jgi:hypothetical protein
MSKFMNVNFKKKPDSPFDLSPLSRGIQKPFKFEWKKPKQFERCLPVQTECIIGQLCGHDTILDVIDPHRHNRPYLQKYNRASVAATARMLGCSRYAIDRIVKTFTKGGTIAVGQLRWKSGKPMKFHGLSQNEMDVIVSKKCLVSQVGMSLNEKAASISRITGKLISTKQLRRLYDGRGVTFQLPQVRAGKPKLQPPEQ